VSVREAVAPPPDSVEHGYADLREWLARVEALGELKVIHGADWRLEIAAIAELARLESKQQPALLFDRIPGYPAGYRVLTGMHNTVRRLALSTHLPALPSVEAYVRRWKERAARLQPLPPRYVEHGPILENVLDGDAVDLGRFPTPLWHQHDGGRYLGTASVTFTTDPAREWLSLGSYRAVVHDRQTLGFRAAPGTPGRLHREQWWAAGKPCPVVVSFGHDPLLFLAASCLDLGVGESALDLAGAIRGAPVEVIHGAVSGLPIPAHAEIVAEGEAYAGDELDEGPFGALTGYYAGGRERQPVIRVKRLYYRDDPIITACLPARAPSELALARSPLKSAAVWTTLEQAGLRGIRGVCLHPPGATYFFTVVSIRQLYAGHARQAAMLAASVPGAGRYARWVIVVDEDVNPFDLDDVLWALCTRCYPHRDVEINTRTGSGPLDPMVRPGDPPFGSVALVDATRPWEWKEQFPPAITFDAAAMQAVRERWGALLGLR
jgi:UbiD family decarboxylase